jgi:flavin-dependent dehydrogenase
MVGDAFGFVDPMLSPGVFLALRSAEMIADAVIPFVGRAVVPSPAELGAALRAYAVSQTAMLAAWQELVAYLYDGRLVAMLLAGQDWLERGTGVFKAAMQQHIERHVALQASGMATTARYSRGLLRLLGRYGLRGIEPGPLAIR